MEDGFDVALMREFMARQAADANRIVMLCDALQKQAGEIAAMRAAAAKAPAAPNPEKGK